MCLSGQPIDAKEALQCGLVSRVLPADQLLDAALALAEAIAAKSRPVALAAKDAVNKAYETTLATGVEYERRVFHATFALKDRKEGMEAFAAKRKPNFVHE